MACQLDAQQTCPHTATAADYRALLVPIPARCLVALIALSALQEVRADTPPPLPTPALCTDLREQGSLG